MRYGKEKPEGGIKTYLKTCDLCKQSNPDSFQIVKKIVCCEAKISEALVIRNENPPFNKIFLNKARFFT